LAFSSVAAVPIVAISHWYSNRGKKLKRNDRSIRKRTIGCAGAPSGKHGTNKKISNHKTLSVSCGRLAQGGATTTTTTMLTAPEKEYCYPDTGEGRVRNLREEML